MKLLLNTKVVSGENKKEKGVTVHLENIKDGSKSSVETDVVLVSIGRHPFTGGLALDKAGLKTNERGQLEINEHW